MEEEFLMFCSGKWVDGYKILCEITYLFGKKYVILQEIYNNV